MLEDVLRRLLRSAFGGGSDISAANPLPVTSEAAIENGTATGGSDVTLEDNTKDWEVNMWADAILQVEIGGVEYHRTITSNTDDTLTFNALPALVVVSDEDKYSIRRVVSPFNPLSRVIIQSTAEVAGVDILPAALAPINVPCLFRIQVAFDAAGVFSTTVTNGGVPVTTEFNHGVVLVADSLFMKGEFRP
ncbi:unnamed protein product, partial [marine sediment metagenome]